MSRSRCLLALAIVALTALVASPTLTSAAPADISSDQINMVAYNTCNWDPIEFTGTLHMAFRVTLDANGVMHVGATSTVVNFKGTDLVDGTSYVGVSASTNQASFDVNPYTLNENTLEGQSLMISQDGTPNLVAHTLIHVTFDANGRLTSSKFDITSECQGMN